MRRAAIAGRGDVMTTRDAIDISLAEGEQEREEFMESAFCQEALVLLQRSHSAKPGPPLSLLACVRCLKVIGDR